MTLENFREKKSGIVIPIIIALITLSLSIGGSVFVSGKTTGADAEKLSRAERDLKELQTDYKSDHDIIIQMNTKLTNIENLLKEVNEKINK